MVLNILLGRARTGKSERILREIRALGDTSQQILLVPEHASHVAEVDMCRVCGDTASRHAEVLTFKLLASRVLALTGGLAEVTLDNGGKLLTVQRTLQELAPVLKVYRRPSQRTAFLKSLLALLEELQAYAVVPELLLESAEKIAGESGERLRDIALIYAAYEKHLCENGHDSRDRLEKLEENLENSHYIDGKDIFLDGFSYFTGRESNILRIMLRRAKSVTVTLLGDSEDRDLFAQSLRVRERLYELAREMNVTCREEELHAAAPQDAITHIERNFLGGAEKWTRESDCVRLYEAGDSRSECEWAAAEILRLVREEGYRYRDITVTARDLTGLQPVIESVFRRYGVPLYTARRSNILDQNVSALLLGALDAVSGGFEYEDMFAMLKTGLAGLSVEEADTLENYVIKWQIRGNMWLSDGGWTGHPEGYGIDWNDAYTAHLAKINALRERVRTPLRGLYDGVHGKNSARDKVKALYAFCTAIRLPEALGRQTEELFRRGETRRAEELAQLWNILCRVMDQFVEILGDCTLDAEEFSHLFRLVLTQYSIGTIPVSLDQVNCSEMTRNDRHAVKCLFILGANDHVLPSVGGQGGILKDEDRMALEAQNIRLSPFGMEQLNLEIQNIYAALAQPTEHLYISYPVSDNQGTELRPSFIIGRVQALCPDVSVEKESTDKEYRLTASIPALECAAEKPHGLVWQYFAESGSNGAILHAMEEAARYERGKLSREAVHGLYGKTIRLSASKMDKARSCHFAYFMQYGLKAKRRESAGFDAPQIGSFVHDVLENTLREAEKQGGIKTLDKARLHQLTRASIEAFSARELPDLASKNARFRYLYRRLCELLYRIMDEVAEELQVSDFVPMKFELNFGENGELPGIVIEEGGSEVRLEGKVDRVDGWLHDGKLYLRVVDYKTGKKTFDLAKLYYGLDIQMLLYLFALKQHGSELFGCEIEPAGVLYVPGRNPILKADRSISDAELAKEMHKELRRSGMVLDEPEVLRAMEHSALESPCYLPVSVKTDKKSGEKQLVGDSIASAEQLGKLGLYVEKLLHRIAAEMNAGNIDADPWKQGSEESACTYCEFRTACHFENGRGGDHMEYIRKTEAEDLWKHVDETIGEGEKYGG